MGALRPQWVIASEAAAGAALSSDALENDELVSPFSECVRKWAVFVLLFGFGWVHVGMASSALFAGLR